MMAILLSAMGLTAPLSAQQPGATPKGEPFKGFGNTMLDKPVRGRVTPSPFNRGPGKPLMSATPTTPVPAVPSMTTPPGSGSGIVLSKDWDGRVTQGTGGQTMKMDDLRALFSLYGAAEADVKPHPEVTVYEGPPMDANLGTNVRIPYLMPLEQAEHALMVSRGMPSHSRAVCPGFPDGLFLHTYDVKFGRYNRLTLVTDSAKQVVMLQVKNERENWHPLHWREVPRDWHVYDHVNTRNRGQPGLAIHVRVNDMRKRGGYIVVNMAFGIPPPTPPMWVQVQYRPTETTTWYVPEPLIKLSLFTLQQQGNR